MIAVACIVVSINVVMAIAWLWLAAGDHGVPQRIPSGIFFMTTLVTVGVIFGVSTAKVVMLRAGGGAAVAGMMGARRLEPATRDPLERRLLNVVEEMAIAAGARVPAVYVMDEEKGINAFAAGYDVSSSIIAVTRGTLETLTRDELQGVIGHEFSHIVNGDMSLNIRMIGILAGIVFLGTIGGFVMRNTEGRSKEAGTLFFVGLAVYVVGYIGLFFARLIKASISRQREYLADAAGVQFTRTPDGLAGALDQIRASTSLVATRHAEDVSHLFFVPGVKMALENVFARTLRSTSDQRINPRFQSQMYRSERAKQAIASATEAPPESIDSPAAWCNRWPVPARAWIGQRWGNLRTRPRRCGSGQPQDGRRAACSPRFRRLSARKFAILTARRRRSRALLLAQNDAVMKAQLEAVSNAARAAWGRGRRDPAADPRPGPAYYLPVVDLGCPRSSSPA